MREKRPRNEGAGTSSESRSRPGAGTDVEEVSHRRSVARLLRERPPQEVLVERERAGVRVTLLEVDVRGLQVRGREHDAFANRGLEARNMPCDSLLDAVGVAFAQGLRPGSVPDV